MFADLGGGHEGKEIATATAKRGELLLTVLKKLLLPLKLLRLYVELSTKRRGFLGLSRLLSVVDLLESYRRC